MRNSPTKARAISVPRRALIVQRVIVDGWSSGEAAAAFDVSKRQVDVWVAEFRRYGMRSLRRRPSTTLRAEIVHLAISRPVRGIARKIASRLRRLFLRERLPQPLPLQPFYDDRRSRD
jgi:transposase-like protein